MIGKTLALSKRALQYDSRDIRGYLFRVALGGLILWLLFLMVSQSTASSAEGLFLFSCIAFTNHVFITLSGASFFASAITEEKEERSLALLKMANIGPLALLIGKWIPRLISAFLLIAIQIPFTMLAITLGGITWDQVTAVFLALLAHLFFVGNLGLLCSVVMSRTTYASGVAIVILATLHAVPPFLLEISRAAIRGGFQAQWLWEVLEIICRGLVDIVGYLRIAQILSVGFNQSPFALSPQLIGNLAGGALLFLLSWLLFNPCTRNDIETDVAPFWTKSLFRRRGARAPRRSWDAALVWKDFQYTAGGWPLFRSRMLAYGTAILGFYYLGHGFRFLPPDWELLGGISFATTLFMLPLEIPFATTRVYRNELSDKTWSTLSMLPRSMAEIAYHKLAGSLLALLPCLLWMGLGLLLILDEVLDDFVSSLAESESLLALSLVLVQFVLAFHVATWLSVGFRWAMWPVAIFLGAAITFFGNIIAGTCLFATTFSDDSLIEAVILGWITVSGFITAWVHVLTGRKLRDAAAES